MKPEGFVIEVKETSVIKIDCPWCGPRTEDEFVNGGEAHVARPGPANEVSEEEWADYLFFHDNPKGQLAETWFHKYGCRQWFNVVRDTVSHKVLSVYPIGADRTAAGQDQPPDPVTLTPQRLE